jgi:phospholipid/cholesterol/gamma-HCH transport system substrate-binding protein
MRRAIREHLRDFLAIGALIIAAVLVTGLILSQQQQPYPSWIPILGDDTFTLKADLSTAQAVTPGQGQTVNIAGVKAGDISDVELQNGHAVVTMLIDKKYQPLVHADASVLLRPRTGLQDMTMEIDPGTPEQPEMADGATIPLADTLPNVQPDQILASLDGDTRQYLQLLIQGGAEGLGGRGKQLSATLRRFEPLGKNLAEIGTALAVRRKNIAQVITSFDELGSTLARTDVQLSDWVTSQNGALGAFADSEAGLRQTLQELPSTLVETRKALSSGDQLAKVLGPASEALIPAAQAFLPAQQSAQKLFTQTVGPIRDQIRPFARETQPPVKHLAQAAGPLAETTKGLTSSFSDLNQLFNALAYDPPGSKEGDLFYLAWLNHNTNNMFTTQSAHGPLRRGTVLQSCQTAALAETFSSVRPFIRTLQQITNVPPSKTICPLDNTSPPPILTPPSP